MYPWVKGLRSAPASLKSVATRPPKHTLLGTDLSTVLFILTLPPPLIDENLLTYERHHGELGPGSALQDLSAVRQAVRRVCNRTNHISFQSGNPGFAQGGGRALRQSSSP